MLSTVKPGILITASAFPNPPFDSLVDGVRSGFDIELMHAICKELGLQLQTVTYTGTNFTGIFDGLANRVYDAVASGTAITPERARAALFSKPYLEFGQGVAVNRLAHPNVRSADNLKGLVAGVQQGTTAVEVARKLVANGILASITYYAYDRITQALDDLEANRIGLIIKPHPTICELVKGRPKLAVPIEIPTDEKLGIAFARDNTQLCNAVNEALDRIRANGVITDLQQRWITS